MCAKILTEFESSTTCAKILTEFETSTTMYAKILTIIQKLNNVCKNSYYYSKAKRQCG